MRTSLLRGAAAVTAFVMLSTPLAALADEPLPYGGAVTVAPAPIGPRIIKDYDDGEPVPSGYHPETRARLGLVIGGSVTFGVFYMFSILAAGVANLVGSNGGLTPLYLPVVGPFVSMVNVDGQGKMILALDGAVQAAGVVMLIAGIAAPKTVLVRDALSARVVPMSMGKGGYGMGVAGSF